MKRIIYTFFMGMLCALSSIGQPFDVVLNTAQQGNITVQARNSITLAAGYSYTPNGGTFLTQIVNPVITGFTSYATAIDQSSYSINTSLAVGKTPGELNVSGMASYTVPLDLPKGSAGLQPNLSLNYMSSFNDGIMGIGWNMGGLSTISRVNQNLYFETQSNPIKGDLTDKYVLDGKRLIVTSGTYGTDNSVYGTELEEFSKVTAKGSSGASQGPAYFEVRTKSGLICEYGNTTDSKVLRDATCVLTWKINKVTDRYGNYITFTYFESDDERPILQIDYTGNSTLGKTPFAQVNFRYKQRSDISTYVYGGKEFTRDILLDNIEVKNNGQTYKKYAMEYMLDNYAQLQKITEYSSQNQPLNPLVFTYTDQTEQFTHPTHYTNAVKELFYNGDFNGDGYMDFVTVPSKTAYTTSDKWKLYLGSSTGQMASTLIEGYLDANFKGFRSADIDGDGLTDLIKMTNLTVKDEFDIYKYSLSVYKSTGNGFVISSSVPSLSSYCKFDLVDSNGDGILEILRRVASVTINGTNFSASCQLYDLAGNMLWTDNLDLFGQDVGAGLPKPGSGIDQIVDFNGDGCSDILVLFLSSYKLYEFKNTSNKLIQTYSDTNLNSNYQLTLGDFNGDGITDIVRSTGPDHGSWSMLELTKDGFKDHEIYGLSNFSLYFDKNQSTSIDVNGDGKMDIILWGKGQDTNNSANRINVAINKGNGYEYSLTEYTSPVTFDLSPLSPDVPLYFYFADYNGDGRDEFYYSKPGSQKCFAFATGTPSNLLRHTIDGFGTRTQITYDPMSNTTVYTHGSGAQYPLCDFSSGMQLARQVDSEDAMGGLFTTTYQYEGAKIHLKGKGFLGFSKVTSTNSDTGISTESNYAFDTPYYYPKLTSSYTKSGSTVIATLTNTWGTSTYTEANRIFPYVAVSVQKDNLKNLNVTTVVTYPFLNNLYGNVSSIVKDFGGNHTQTTSFVYGNELTSIWLIGRPTTITKNSVKSGVSQTFTISRTYSSTNNSPDIDENNSGDATYYKLNRDYDTFGNLGAEHKYAAGLNETHKTYLYDDNGVNLKKVTDQIGNETNYTLYATTGLPYTQTDPFGNVMTYNYNSFDQVSSVVGSPGITTTITISFDISGGPANARYYMNKSGTDGSQIKVWYDKLGRELRTETRKFGGALVKIDKQYNTKGELTQYSEPSTGTPSSWNVIGHDTYGRINSLDPIFGSTTTYSEPYGNPTATRTVNGRNYKTTIDAAGLVISTEDPGGIITNNYQANGLLASTVAPGGVTSSMTYDKNGNRLTISDPSAGLITNTWYGTGQPKTTANAKGQTTTYTYTSDSKVLLQKTSSPEGDTNYSYFTNGLVSSITSPGGITRAYTYTQGKILTVTETAPGTTANTITFEYDSKGRLFKKYFNGTSEYEQYDYDTNSGYLYRIQFTAAGTTSTVWQITTMDQYQRITQATIGSAGSTWSYDSGSNLLSGISATGVQGYSYTFDANTGNLGTRTNLLRTKTETFGYDAVNLDRLSSVAGPVNQSVGYTTNKNGNIESKSDAGTYLYENTPYAVTKITGGLNISNDQQIIDYYSFEKVKKITEGTKTADFDYNADHQRIRMVLKTNGTETKTHYYFGGSCEREVISGVTTQYIWIGGDAYTAVAVAKKVGTGAWTVYNIFRDHLGTITHLKTGTSAADEYSFDAWGRRRDKDTWSFTLSGDPALFADRGFTGHEYLEDFKLYNMNGRLYDPVVGRFLSPDPYVQDPGFTQNLNRYSYCLNNPLKFTDPSGNTWWDKFWNWTAEKGIQFGFNMGSGGPVPNISAPGPGNTRVSVGINTQTGQFGIGNDASGFMNFYFPTYDYNKVLKPTLDELGSVRAQYGVEWQANSGNALRSSIYASSTIFNLLNSIEEINAGLNYSANLSSADAWKSVVGRYSKSLSSNLEFSKMSKTLTTSVSRKLTFVGAIYTTYDVSQNFTGENVAWGALDTSIGILGIMSGYATIPSVLYFIGRTSNDVYQSAKPQEPLIFQSKGWREYNKNGY